MQRKLLKSFLLGLVFMCVSCAVFPEHIDPASSSQIPTAEYLLENYLENDLVSFTFPSPGSILEPEHLLINVGISQNIFMQMGLGEENYEAIIRSGKLEVNQQQIEMICCREELVGSRFTEPIYALVLLGSVSLSEGLYMITYSVEMPDGRILSESWAYRVESNHIEQQGDNPPIAGHGGNPSSRTCSQAIITKDYSMQKHGKHYADTMESTGIRSCVSLRQSNRLPVYRNKRIEWTTPAPFTRRCWMHKTTANLSRWQRW